MFFSPVLQANFRYAIPGLIVIQPNFVYFVKFLN